MMKKIIIWVITLAMIVCMACPVVADDEPTINEQLENAYIEISDSANTENKTFNVSFDTFEENYDSAIYSTVEQYKSYYTSQQNYFSVHSSSSGSSDCQWFNDIGTSLPEDHSVYYAKYDLLATIKRGDILYEGTGIYQITGHSAIVEGKFYDSGKGKFYIRLIEAVMPTVNRGLLDDMRVITQGVRMFRVDGASASQITGAIDFCKAQLGKPYDLNVERQNTSIISSSWYCSEMVWAAYYNQGINIERLTGRSDPGVFPVDIRYSEFVTEIPIQYYHLSSMFVDISNHWAKTNILYMIDNGLMDGVDDNQHFAPEGICTRAMAITVLYRAEGEPSVSGSSSFPDVPYNTWYTNAVAWAKQNGIVEGDNGYFGPNEGIKREHLALIMYRYANYKIGKNEAIHDMNYFNNCLSNFQDGSDVSEDCLVAVKWMATKGFFIGRDDGKMAAKSVATRAELATCMRRFFDR